MSISRVKTWSAGEVLTASDLNGEFNNLLNNPVDLWSPAAKAADFNGFEIVVDADADSSITADTDDRLDVRLGGVDLFIFNGTTSSCVNGLTLFGTATGTPAYIRANGSDSNTGVDLRDANGNETLKTAAVASAVNEVTITNAATGNPARIHATGEANVSLQIEPKASGTVLFTDGTDTTKKVSLALSGVTAGSTRTLTPPDTDTKLGPSVIAIARNLTASRPTAATIDVDADEVLLKDSNGGAFLASSVNLTIDITASGANGLDTGAEAGNTWYYVWVIAQAGGTVAGLISTSSTAPTMPAGYTFKALVTATRNDGSSNFISFKQRGFVIHYDLKQNVLTGGSASTETSITITSFVPPIAQRFQAQIFGQGTVSGGTASAGVYLRTITTLNQINAFFSCSDTLAFGFANGGWLPNISQALFYLFTPATNVATIDINVDITAFAIPGGGE